MKVAFFAGVLTIALPAIILYSFESPFPTMGYAIGLTVSFVNAALVCVTNRISIGRELNTFLLRSVVGHGTRLALLAGLILGAILNDIPQIFAVLITVCVGYFSFLFSEIAMLFSRLYSPRSIFSKTEP